MRCTQHPSYNVYAQYACQLDSVSSLMAIIMRTSKTESDSENVTAEDLLDKSKRHKFSSENEASHF